MRLMELLELFVKVLYLIVGMQYNSIFSEQKIEDKKPQIDQPYVINRVLSDMHDVAECLHDSKHKNNQQMILDQTTKVKMIKAFMHKCITKDELQNTEAIREIQIYAEQVSNVELRHYATIKSFARPPNAVIVVAEGCCLLLADYLQKKQGIKDIYYYSAPGEAVSFNYKNFQRLLKDPRNFKKIVRDLNPKNITDDTFFLLKKRIIDNPDFDLNRLKNQSSVALALAEWIKKIYQYHIVKGTSSYRIGRDKVGKQSTRIGDKLLLAALETYQCYFQKDEMQKLQKVWQQILLDFNIAYCKQISFSESEVQYLILQKNMLQLQNNSNQSLEILKN